MARVRIYRDEAGGDDFPRLCMRCGAPADCDVPQTFAWMPAWVHVLLFVGLLPWLVVSLALRRTMRVVAPMCEAHRGHWRVRKLYVWLGLLWWVAVCVALGVFWDQLPKDVTGPAVMAVLFGGLIWLIVGLVLAQSAIKAADIRERRMDLVGVHKNFATAWKDATREGD